MALLDPPMDGAYQPLSLSRREQLFPFSDADIWHLHETRAALEGRLTEDPSDTEADVALAKLTSFRGAIDAVRWGKVQSQQLRELDGCVSELEAAGIDLGPLGAKLRADLRDADGRRRLQPVLEAAARRLGDMPGGSAAQGGAVGGAFAANWEHRQARFEEELAEHESYSGGRQNRRRGRKNDRGGRKPMKLGTLEMDAAFNLLEPEYIIEWLSIAAPLTAQLRQAKNGGAPEEASDGSSARQAVLANICVP